METVITIPPSPISPSSSPSLAASSSVHSFGSIHEEEELNVSDIDASMRNITISDQTHYPYIREMLPISILAFTAAIGDIIIPQMRNGDSILILRRDTPISEDEAAQDSPSKRIDLRYYQNSIEKIMAFFEI